MSAEALELLAAALDGKPKTKPKRASRKLVGHALVAVEPADLIALCDAIPEERRTRTVRELRDGAVNAGKAEEVAITSHHAWELHDLARDHVAAAPAG